MQELYGLGGRNVNRVIIILISSITSMFSLTVLLAVLGIA